MAEDSDQLGTLPPGIMGYSEARRQQNLRDERDTIGLIKAGKEDGCAVMFFGEQTCAIMPVDRVEPHACVTGVHAETFRTWIWEASVSQQVHEGWDEFSDEIRNRFDRAFDVANQFAHRQEVEDSGPEFVTLSGCVMDGGTQNGLLPCGSLVWCCVENEPVWPCRVVGLRPKAYKKLREEALALGYDVKEKTEPVLFFGEDSSSPPPPPVLASLSDCSVFIPGEDKRWIPHYRLRSLKIASERKFRPWSEDAWDNWDVACEIACDCARARSIDPIYEWMSQPSSHSRRRGGETPEAQSDPDEVCDMERLQLGHGPYVNGLGSRETSPSMSSSLPFFNMTAALAVTSEPANGHSRSGKSARSVRKSAQRGNAVKRATEKASSKKPKKKAAPLSPVRTTPKTLKSAILPKSTPKKGRPKRSSPKKPDVVSVPTPSRTLPRRRASQMSTPRRFFEQSPMGRVLDVIALDLDDVTPGPAKVVERSTGNITRVRSTFQEIESSKEPLEVASVAPRSVPTGLAASSQAGWPVVSTARPAKRGGTSGIPDIYSECGY